VQGIEVAIWLAFSVQRGTYLRPRGVYSCGTTRGQSFWRGRSPQLIN